MGGMRRAHIPVGCIRPGEMMRTPIMQCPVWSSRRLAIRLGLHRLSITMSIILRGRLRLLIILMIGRRIHGIIHGSLRAISFPWFTHRTHDRYFLEQGPSHRLLRWPGLLLTSKCTRVYSTFFPLSSRGWAPSCWDVVSWSLARRGEGKTGNSSGGV